MCVATAQAQVANEEVLDRWSAQTGESVSVNRHADGTVAWRSSVEIEGYRRSVHSASDDLELVTPNSDGDFYRSFASGEWSSVQANGSESYFQFAHAKSNDRAMLSRFSSQIITLQAGVRNIGWKLEAGDVAVNYSSLGASTGLRGATLRLSAPHHDLEFFGGAVSDSWERLLGTQPLPLANEVHSRRRNVLGVKLSVPLNEQTIAFATSQFFNEKVVEAGDPAQQIALPAPKENARSSTLGVTYNRAFGPDKTLSVSAELGSSLASIDGSSGTNRGKAGHLSALVTAPWAHARYSFGMGHQYLGLNWAGMGAIAQGGSRDSYISNGLAWENGLSWTHDWRLGAEALPWGNEFYKTRLATSTHRVGWKPAGMNGSSIGLHHVKSNAKDNAGIESRAQQIQAVAALNSSHWQSTLKWDLAGRRYVSGSDERTRRRDWQASITHNQHDLSPNPIRVSAFSVNMYTGRQTFFSSPFDQAMVRSAGLEFSATSPAWGDVSLSHTRQWLHSSGHGRNMPSKTTTLSLNSSIGAGLLLRIYVSYIDSQIGLSQFQYNEQTVGIQIKTNWP